MMQRSTSLYSRVVKTTEHYLGPTAERFVNRQIQTHLGKQPDDLTHKDLEKLIDWLKAVVALLTEGDTLVNDYAADLRKLAKRNKNSK